MLYKSFDLITELLCRPFLAFFSFLFFSFLFFSFSFEFDATWWCDYDKSCQSNSQSTCCLLESVTSIFKNILPALVAFTFDYPQALAYRSLKFTAAEDLKPCFV